MSPDAAYATCAVVTIISCSALWYAHGALSKATKMLKEAGDYWRRSSEVWAAIDATPGEGITEEGLRKMEAFLDAETRSDRLDSV